VSEVEWFRRFPNGGTVYARLDGSQVTPATVNA